ncbi:hypothetical protein JVT61DRAFT_12905 [Boletus reticuloceps]|uniref:Ribonuclease PIN domain-containing protein n=1 Tax=Boletus reticuloceps TaxID=495285 RepID=A0A8I3ADN9_9AGAM|nr:hypothetical protein JVT61DRAFT_12905 [Boletus reticuloceps]
MSRRCKNLVLDSGPLLSLSPLRGLADTYLTVRKCWMSSRINVHGNTFTSWDSPRVSKSASGVLIPPQSPKFAKKTGDYTVLSHADICVLALTHTLQLEENATLEKKGKR